MPKNTPRKPTATATATATVKGALAGAVEAVAKRMPGTDTDALTLLETDHRRLEDLLANGEDTTETAVKTRRTLLKTITSELTTHEMLEEKLLYPALEGHPETRAIALEGFQEHHVADVLLKELHGVSAGNELWAAKFKVLKENLEHHIEEEEGTMFRTARGVMNREELAALGARMLKMKARR
jgi:iron-sulfur cluster repair protein YtfE (RIC family)